MTIVRKFFTAALLLALFLVALAVFLPPAAEVQRAVLIDARAATVFALVNDREQTRKWLPWADADAHFESIGTRRGEGAGFHWESAAGDAGSLIIVRSDATRQVTSSLELGGAPAAHATVELLETDDGTRATWTLQWQFGMNLFARYMGLLLDRNVGGDIETGLANLKSMAERLPRADFSDLRIDEISVDSSDIAILGTSSTPEPGAISEATGAAYFSILRFIDAYGLQEAGAPMIISRGYSGSKILFDAAIPVRGTAIREPTANERVRLGKSYAGPALRVQHLGSYANLTHTHDKIAAYLAAYGIEGNGDSWESYVSDPARTAESELLTLVYYPVRR